MTELRCIALVGLRATGKSTIGRALAAHLGWSFADTDALLADRVGCAAGDYLRSAGEARFRAAEEEVCLDALARAEARVLAFGGGAVISEPVRRGLTRPGVLTVLLEAAPEELVRRAAADPGRPPLTDLAPLDEVRQLWRERKSWYEDVSRLRINTDSLNVDACVARIADKMGEYR